MISAKRKAEAEGVSVDILIAADCPDDTTLNYLATAKIYGARVLVLDLDDLGLARNAAVAASSSRFVAFLDGDDLWGRQWLIGAYRAAVDGGSNVIWHPEANLYFGFGVRPHWLVHPNIDEAEGDWVNLALKNHWTALCFAPLTVFLDVPYRSTMLKSGYGYEDWSWNAETVSKGHLHKAVLGTTHLVRVRSGSLSHRMNSGSVLVTPTTLFRTRVGMTNTVGATRTMSASTANMASSDATW
jgi:glycosyltransferase involved in cell wall biosynthesis